MKRLHQVFALSTLSVVLCAGAIAQDHHDDHHGPDNSHFVQHSEWKKGYHMNTNDWNRGDRVDYRQYHLSAPPNGYEWRRVDGNYVMAAVATGVIASAIVASSVH